MEFDNVVLQTVKIFGFVLIAFAVGSAVWSGFSIKIVTVLTFVIGILFSGGGFLFSDMKSPSEEELMKMKERELDELYMPAEYRQFDKKRLKYEALHRLTDQKEGIGDFSGTKGH